MYVVSGVITRERIGRARASSSDDVMTSKQPSTAPQTGTLTMASLQPENQQLQFDIGDRDVEMERMKITLFALNERVAMVAALNQDGDEQRTYLATSEYKRNDL